MSSLNLTIFLNLTMSPVRPCKTIYPRIKAVADLADLQVGIDKEKTKIKGLTRNFNSNQIFKGGYEKKVIECQNKIISILKTMATQNALQSNLHHLKEAIDPTHLQVHKILRPNAVMYVLTLRALRMQLPHFSSHRLLDWPLWRARRLR